MKRCYAWFCSFILVIILLCGTTFFSVYADESAALVCSSVSGEIGSNVTVNVYITEGAKIAGAKFSLAFDEEYVSVVADGATALSGAAVSVSGNVVNVS